MWLRNRCAAATLPTEPDAPMIATEVGIPRSDPKRLRHGIGQLTKLCHNGIQSFLYYLERFGELLV